MVEVTPENRLLALPRMISKLSVVMSRSTSVIVEHIDNLVAHGKGVFIFALKTLPRVRVKKARWIERNVERFMIGPQSLYRTLRIPP